MLVLSAVPAFASNGVSEKIVKLISIGNHQGAECAVSVKKEGPVLTLSVQDERDEILFVLDSASESNVVTVDNSTENSVEVVVRRNVVDQAGISVQMRKLVITDSFVKLSVIKRGITGRLNSLMSIQCDI